MINNQLSDMFTRIKNAIEKNFNIVNVNYTKLNYSILKILFVENLIKGYSIYKNKNNSKLIKIFLLYRGWWIKKPCLHSLKIISKPRSPIFITTSELKKKIFSSFLAKKLTIISTSSGIITLQKALSLKKGGKILCCIN